MTSPKINTLSHKFIDWTLIVLNIDVTECPLHIFGFSSFIPKPIFFSILLSKTRRRTEKIALKQFRRIRTLCGSTMGRFNILENVQGKDPKLLKKCFYSDWLVHLRFRPKGQVRLVRDLNQVVWPFQELSKQLLTLPFPARRQGQEFSRLARIWFSGLQSRKSANQTK